MKSTFDIHLHYKSGQSVTVRGMLTFEVKDNGKTFAWTDGYRDKILMLGVDDLAAVTYTINPWYKSLFYFLWRKM